MGSYRRYGFLVAAAALWVGCQGAAAAPEWRLAWEDRFDTLDEKTWRRVHSTEPTNRSLQAYLPEQVTVESGCLVITSEKRPYRGLLCRSGQIVSRAEQRLGRWEVRAKLPTGRGMWPAIWLLPDTGRHRWPSGGEIDIVENRGNQPHRTSSAFHYGTTSPYQHLQAYTEQQTVIRGRLIDYHDGFHIYAVDWTESSVRFYVDGVNHFTLYDEEVGGFLSSGTQPMQLVINNAIGGTFLPDPDKSTVWPQRMEVDWVRVYELRGDSREVAFENGGFDESLVGWSLFGAQTNHIHNIQVTDEVAQKGRRSLKLSGAFNADNRHSGVSQGVTVVPGGRVVAKASARVASDDPLAGSSNRALMKVEFYSSFGASYGSGLLREEEVVLADAGTPSDRWHARGLAATVPEGAVEARLVLLFDQPAEERGAVFVDDVAFESISPREIK